MSDNGVTVFFAGDTSGLTTAVEKAKSTVGGFGDSLKSLFGKVDLGGLSDAFKGAGADAEKSGTQASSSFDKLKSTVEGVTLGIAALAIAATGYLVGVGLRAVSLGENVKTSAGAFDQTTTAMSALSSVADRSGVSLSSLGKSFFDLQKNAASGNDATVAALNAIGLKAKDVAGLSQDALAVKMADAFSTAKDSANKAAVGVALFGSEVAGKLVPQLDQGAARMKELTGAADRAGTVIGPELTSKIAGTSAGFQSVKDSMAELKLTLDGMSLQSFVLFKPAIDGIVRSFSDLVKNVASAIEWFSGLGSAATNSAGLLDKAYEAIGSGASTFAAAVVRATIFLEEMGVRGAQYIQGLGAAFNGLSAVATAFGNDLSSMASVSSAAFYAAFNSAIGGVITLFGDLADAGKKALAFDLAGVRAGFAQFGADADVMGAKLREAMSPSYFAGTAKAMADMKAAAGAEGAELDKVIAKLEAQKAAQLALIAAGGAKGPTPGKTDVSDPSVKETPDDGSAERNRVAITAIDGEIAVLRKALAAREELYTADVKLKILSEAEKLTNTKAAIDAEYAAEKALLEKELQLSDLSADQKQTALNKMKALDQKYASDSQKIMDQSVERMVAPWHRMVDSMSSTLSSGIMGMLERTKSFSDVLRSIAQSITQDFVKMGVDVVADWAKKQISLVALSFAGETQKTAAATAGATARETIGAGEAAASAVANIGSVIKSIEASAAAAFAGVVAFLSPVLGPAAVGPAAATEATVLASIGAIGGSYAVGSWQLQSDQIAQVHAGEMIVPAGQTPWAQALMSNAAGGGGSQGSGGGGDTHVHLQVQTENAQSFERYMHSEGGLRKFAQAFNRHLASNPSLRPRT